MPASAGGAINAGLTFAVPRNLHSLPPGRIGAVLRTRLDHLREASEDLSAAGRKRQRAP